MVLQGDWIRREYFVDREVRRDGADRELVSWPSLFLRMTSLTTLALYLRLTAMGLVALVFGITI